jgi:hypothetical protein
MGKEMKVLDRDKYDELCHVVRHVVTESRALFNRVKKLEELINNLTFSEIKNEE